MRAINLKTEYLINPIGIDIAKPRLFWNCEDGVKQTAYYILAVDEDGNVLWNTGKVEGSAMTHIIWGGNALKPRTKIIWKVKLWDEKGEEGEWSEPATFELGIDKWQAEWICGHYKVNKKNRYPVDCFKRNFRLDKKVKSARLYITACGLYEARLNNRRVGDFVLAPGHTDYRKRIQYQTYDITELIKNGENEI
ncbi:MAG: alpha-L-rhamnosidase N-terminal domain-containing protein, partial [Eubacterium sp.]